MPPTEAQHATTETAIAVMARDIHYVKDSLLRVEGLLAEAAKNSVTHAELAVFQKTLENIFIEREKDLSAYKSEQGKCNDDFEKRIRVVESSVTKILQWGTILGVGFTIVQFVLNKYF